VFGGANGTLTFPEILLIAVDVLLAKAFAEKVGGALDLASFVPPPSPVTDDVGGSAEILSGRTRDPLQMWLRSMGAEECYAKFTAEGITMRMLSQLTEAHLKDMGITSLPMRLSILAGIDSVKMSMAAANKDPSLVQLTAAVSALCKSVDEIVVHKKE